MTTPERKSVTLHRLREMHAAGEKIAMLTCYDATLARVLDDAGVDILLVGDSLGMVLQGLPSTVPVTLEAMAYHTRCVAAARTKALVLGDLPYGSYHESPAQAFASARTLMQAGAQMVKLECGAWSAETVGFLVERGVPVCAHLGFTPQTVDALGGYRVQGRDAASAERTRADAQAMAQAGAQMLLFEMVPAALAREIAAAVAVPVIGIGAGVGVGGQVLVLHDMLDLTPGKRPRFVRNFMEGGGGVAEAVRRYVGEVKAGTFPRDDLHAY